MSGFISTVFRLNGTTAGFNLNRALINLPLEEIHKTNEEKVFVMLLTLLAAFKVVSLRPGGTVHCILNVFHHENSGQNLVNILVKNLAKNLVKNLGSTS